MRCISLLGAKAFLRLSPFVPPPLHAFCCKARRLHMSRGSAQLFIRIAPRCYRKTRMASRCQNVCHAGSRHGEDHVLISLAACDLLSGTLPLINHLKRCVRAWQEQQPRILQWKASLSDFWSDLATLCANSLAKPRTAYRACHSRHESGLNDWLGLALCVRLCHAVSSAPVREHPQFASCMRADKQTRIGRCVGPAAGKIA